MARLTLPADIPPEAVTAITDTREHGPLAGTRQKQTEGQRP